MKKPSLAKKIAKFLKVELGDALVTTFSEGEIRVKINEDVRGRDVFIVQPTCPPVNENILELLIMIDSFLRASAYRITAVLPYFGYARQDRKDAGRVPITIIRGTMDAVGKAGKFFEGLAAAGKAAVEEAKRKPALPEKQVEETKPPQ